MTDKQHGGKRLGAGRKSLPVSERLRPVTVRLTESQIAHCKTHGGVSEYIRRLVNEKM